MIWAVLVFVWVFVWAPLLLCAHPVAVAPRSANAADRTRGTDPPWM